MCRGLAWIWNAGCLETNPILRYLRGVQSLHHCSIPYKHDTLPTLQRSLLFVLSSVLAGRLWISAGQKTRPHLKLCKMCCAIGGLKAAACMQGLPAGREHWEGRLQRHSWHGSQQWGASRHTLGAPCLGPLPCRWAPCRGVMHRMGWACTHWEPQFPLPTEARQVRQTTLTCQQDSDGTLLGYLGSPVLRSPWCC